MKKALLPLTIALAAPMTSLADVTVYGQANLSVDMLDNGADYSELNLSSNSSRLGFKADKEFDGFTAIMKIEQQVDFDSGGVFTGKRDVFVGLSGDFGMVRAGQFDSPFKLARGPANLFGDQLGDIRNITRVGNAQFDERNPNSIHYQTPKFGDLQFNVAYSISETQTNQDGLSDDSISLSATYSAGPVNLAAAFETYGEDHSAGERDAIRLAGAYSLTPELALVGFFQSVDQDNNDALSSDVVGVGAEYKLNEQTSLKGQYLTRSTDADDLDSDMFTLGVAHRLDSSLSLYANYGFVANDDFIALTPYNVGRSTSVPTVAGEDTSGLSVGLSFSF